MSNVIKKIGEKVKLIEGNDETRAQKCLEDVKKICEAYDCILVPSMTIQGCQATNYRFDGDVGIVPISREAPKNDKK